MEAITEKQADRIARQLIRDRISCDRIHANAVTRKERHEREEAIAVEEWAHVTQRYMVAG